MKAIGIVASTGGPQALARVLGALPAQFPVPLLVVQHRIDGSTANLVRAIAGRTRLAVRVAADGERLMPVIYLAPDRCELELDRSGRLRVSASSDWAHAGDRLLLSLADSCGEGACGVVLTGLGDDGSTGLAAIRAAGGLTLCEDERHAVAASMPASASGAARYVAPLDQISRLLQQHFGANS